MITTGQQSAKLAGLQILLSMTIPGIRRDKFWHDWCEKFTILYAAEVQTSSAHSPALRTLALFTSIISIDQALAMPGGFDAISQRYPIIGVGPLVPYPLYMTPDHGSADPDLAAVAVATAVGKYLVDHPALPWASGPPDRFGTIGSYLDRLTKANLDDLSGLGSAAAYAVNAEFRGLERTSMGPAILKLPMPSQFRQLFRDWADGRVNLVELRDQ